MTVAVLGMAFVALSGCQEGAAPFLQVQFCLTDDHRAPEFKQAMQAIAVEEDMRFGDRSEDAEAELRSLPDTPESIQGSFPLVLISGWNDEQSFGASNAGLGSDQVAIGFGGPETPSKRAFASRTIQKLDQIWDIVTVPESRGALPLDCAV
jgi:hypothetical protein